MKNSILFIALILVLPLFILGCDDNNDTKSTVLTENDFATDSTLKANPQKGIVVTFLEDPTSEVPELDTGVIGIDVIPYKYSQTIEQTFCWEDDDVDAAHFMELKDSEGNEVVRVDANGECVTVIIEPGNYVMNIYVDGTIEDSRPIFIIPQPEDIEQSRKSNGLFNRFKFAVLNIIEKIQNNTIRNAEAQTVQENIDTLLSTNECLGCDLRGADFSGADLEGAYLEAADLTGADLSLANLINANLVGVILIDAILSFSDLTGALLPGSYLSNANFVKADLSGTTIISSLMINVNLTGADLTGADVRHCNLSGAVLTGADLTRTDFDSADLTGADLSFANLIRAVLTGANLTGTDLSGAIWCDMCRCADPSIGTCVGCPPAKEVCTRPFG